MRGRISTFATKTTSCLCHIRTIDNLVAIRQFHGPEITADWTPVKAITHADNFDEQRQVIK